MRTEEPTLQQKIAAAAALVDAACAEYLEAKEAREIASREENQKHTVMLNAKTRYEKALADFNDLNDKALGKVKR